MERKVKKMRPPKTIGTIYKYDTDQEQNMLPDMSSYSEGFKWWNDIYTNSTFTDIDTLFARMYYSYIFYSPFRSLFDDYNDQFAAAEFKSAVKGLFEKNRKKYEELYNIETIADDEAYALTNNYDMHETYAGNNATQGSAITGQRTDVNVDNIGSQNSAGLNKVTGFNSSDENTNTSDTNAMGSRQDTHQFTKGQEQDTSQTQGQDSHTLRRWGNIGVQSVDDMIQKRKNTWLPWSFLQIIFDDICSEFLLIGDDRVW